MAYEYNKKFFRDWFEREKIKKKDLLQVIQTSSANNLQIWLLEREPTPLKEGQTDTGDRDWLPLRCILRLCNHYGLKISNFIINAEEPAPQKGRKDNRQQLEIAAMKNELLQAKLDHQEEINAIHAKYLEREDRIRKQYDKTIQELLKRLPDKQATMESISSMVNDPLDSDVIQPKRG